MSIAMIDPAFLQRISNLSHADLLEALVALAGSEDTAAKTTQVLQGIYTQRQQVLTEVLAKPDVWVHGILPSVGFGYDITPLAYVCGPLQEHVLEADKLLLRRKETQEIWTNIFAFLGPGHYLYVALVCKPFQKLYQAYFDTIQVPPRICDIDYNRMDIVICPAIATGTFYSAAFSSVSCAKLWDKIERGVDPVIDRLIWKVMVKYGNLQVVKWAHGNGFPFPIDDTIICGTAALRGHLEVLKWAREQNFPWNENTCAVAARKGHFEVLKWARENECPWNDVTCCWAAEGGHLEMLKWAREHNCPWNEITCREAAKGGHLEVLKWARENNCPWDAGTCSSAAQGGHLEVLKWARGNGCHWDVGTCWKAAMGGHLEVLKWARENQCPWNEGTCAGAASFGHLEMLKWARGNGCHWDARTCTWAADRGHLAVLKWARENDCPCDEEEVRAAAEEYDQQEILDWLDTLEN